jgi:hypothetical protein
MAGETIMALSKIPTNMQSALVASDIPAITAGMQPDGSVVQIVNTVWNNNAGASVQGISASASSVEITDLRTTFTPKLAGSHFLVQCNVMHGQGAAGWMHCKFSRDVNSTYQAEILEQSWYANSIYGGGIESRPWFNKVDTGATYTVGDTITYKFYANTQNATTLTVNWNNNSINNSTSSVTIMEIAQ